MNGKIILAAALGFVSGAAAGAALAYIFAYKKIEAEQIERTNKEIDEARRQTIQYVLKRHGYSEPTEKVEEKITTDAEEKSEVDEREDRTGYSKIFKSSNPIKVKIPQDVVTDGEINMTNSKEPVFVDDYDSLVAITPHGESKIYDWIFYENFRGGLMVDNESDQVINFPLLLHMSSKELKRFYKDKGNEIYIYLPDDSIGVRIYIEPSVSPNLLEYDIPAQLYPNPTDDEDDEDEDEDEDYYEEPDWGD